MLGVTNSRYKKYPNYEQALHAYNASLQAVTPSQVAIPSNYSVLAAPHTDERLGLGEWKNLVILGLLLLVVALCLRITMSG